MKAAHYDVIKLNNKRLLRNLVRVHNKISKKELVELSGLSFPTVSAAIGELIEKREIIENLADSNGGRPGSVYCLNSQYAATACVSLNGFDLELTIYDYCGEVIEEYDEVITSDADESTIVEIFRKIQMKYPNLLCATLGIPGVVVDGEIKHLPYLKLLEKKNIQKSVKEKLGLLLLIENDINTIAMGDIDLGSSFAHIFWNRGCIGSAICIENTLLRGSHGSAGEIEYLCEEKLGKMACLKQAVLAMSCVVDVPIIAISGEEVVEDDIEKLQEMLQEKLASFRIPKIIYKAEEQGLYKRGLWQIALKYLRENI